MCTKVRKIWLRVKDMPVSPAALALLRAKSGSVPPPESRNTTQPLKNVNVEYKFDINWELKGRNWVVTVVVDGFEREITVNADTYTEKQAIEIAKEYCGVKSNRLRSK
jgi:hypothetical protein